MPQDLTHGPHEGIPDPAQPGHGTRAPALLAALLTHFEARRFAQAAQAAGQLTRLQPQLALAWNALGASLGALGRFADSLPAAQRAVALAPLDPQAHNNLGNTLAQLGRLEEAQACFERVLELQPDHVGAMNSLGATLRGRMRLADAEAQYRRVLAIAPAHAEARNNLGNVLLLQNRAHAACDSYRQALALRPQYAEAHNNLGIALQALGQLDAAQGAFRSALQLQPDYLDAHSNLLFCLNYTDVPPAVRLAEARRFGQHAARRAPRTFSCWTVPEEPRRLRIGLVSGDFCHHPVAYFLENLLLHLDPRVVEVYAYPSSARSDEITQRIRKLCAAWHPLSGFDDAGAAERIHRDAVQVLIDLSGHTADHRLGVFACKPAPVQLTWLGYFATTGLPAMDYFLADRHSLPEEAQSQFTESVWYLPETRLCFTRPDAEIPVAPLPALRNGHLTFGSFNNLSKLNARVVNLWVRLLEAVPGSRLLIKAKQLHEPDARNDLLRAFGGRIAGDRLLIEGPSPRPQYLARYGDVDIALDPFPYTGGATSAEALWMGVPVLTLEGEALVARQGLGLLRNCGLDDWIARDPEDYVHKAARRAADLQGLADLRAGMRARLLHSPLFDGARFARDFEAALLQMWEKWRQHNEPGTTDPRRAGPPLTQ
jgi:predicted O-linked N-acetylglucosamine transferase (SPINDLY family)